MSAPGDGRTPAVRVVRDVRAPYLDRMSPCGMVRAFSAGREICFQEDIDGSKFAQALA